MKAALDTRAQLTTACIRQAFTMLLEEKPIQRISVTELCRKAGVNRSTFYAHYQDIYDLLDKIEEEMLEELTKALAPLLDSQSGELSPLQITTGIYQCLRDNADVYTIALGEHGDRDFALRLLDIGRESCLAGYSRQFPQVSPQRLEYFYAFASGGHMSLLRKWMEEGMTVPAQAMAQLSEELMLRGMEYLQGGAAGAVSRPSG